MTEQSNIATRESALADIEREQGARFDEYFGWRMASSFGDAVAEYKHVRAAAGLVDLSYQGAIKVAGKEAVQFLNGLVTNDVKSLSRGKGMVAAFLTGHGKVRALCRVLGLGEEFLIINDPQTHEKVFKYIFPFSYAGDFRVEDASDNYRTISVQGPASLAVMKEVCFEPVPSLGENDWIETILAGQHVLVSRSSRAGEAGYDILAPQDGLRDVWEFILMKGEFHSVKPIGLEALERLRIEAGLPLYGKDVDESNMMLETGLADAVSFTKGCYTGQEAVAMATYRGHVSKKLSGLNVSGSAVPSHGDRIIKDGKDIGFITSAIDSPLLGGVIALGYLKYGFFDPGTQVEVQAQGGGIQASVVELPFYRKVESAK